MPPFTVDGCESVSHHCVLKEHPVLVLLIRHSPGIRVGHLAEQIDSAIAFGSVEGQYDALLQAWYPGQGGAKALAEVLFGLSQQYV